MAIMSPKQVTLVGAGNMGAALGHALVKAGMGVTVWNRTRHRAQVEALVEAGARFEADVGAALAHSDGAVMVCLLDYDTMYRILGPVASGVEGKTVINLTTGTPRQGRDAAGWFKGRGASRYFEGSILGLPSTVGTPTATLPAAPLSLPSRSW